MRHSGFTLIEMAVAAGILSLAIVAAADLVSTTGDTLARGTAMANLDAKANALLGKIERDLVKLVPRADWGRFPHLLIWHGRRVCDARRPRCEDCVLVDLCPSSRIEIDAIVATS